jgi:hypothetical protein
MPTPQMPTPQQAASAASEAVRNLNHATIFGDGYEWPSDVDATIAALHELVSRLPQALSQASRWLAAAHDAGAVGHDRGADVDEAVSEIEELLIDAERGAWRLAETLDAAHQETSHLTGLIDRTDEADDEGGEVR